jgi:hypothetical protein
VAGLAAAGCAIAFTESTRHSSSELLFCGQAALPSLVLDANARTVGALVLAVLFTSAASAISLSCFHRPTGERGPSHAVPVAVPDGADTDSPIRSQRALRPPGAWRP